MVNNKDILLEKESSEKKRRKTSNADASTSKHQKEDVYESVISHEEQEALKRSPEKDMELFHHTCGELKKIFEDVAALKKDNSDKAKAELSEKHIQGSFIFVLLKKLNRLDKIRIRSGRDTLHKEKLRVDSNRLQLQNLLYELNHLTREVQRCYQFKSQDEEIDLVSENEFYENAPESISCPDKTKTDEHARRLARLEWELHQRKELSSLCKDMTIAKENASKDIALKTERLESLSPCLETLLKATRPLQTALEMNIENEWEVQKSARLLPRPLYLVYANLNAYSEACMPQLNITIEGDEEEAKQLEIIEKKDNVDEEDVVQESDTEENETNELRKKHHKRQLLKVDETRDDKLKRLLKYHPLSVTFKITEPSNGSISVTLWYLPILDFVTAKPQILMDNVGVAAGYVISPESILNCLQNDDYGNVSPNPKTKYQLKEFGINEEKLMELLNECNIGKPYKWAQKLCGLEFVMSIQQQQQQPTTSASTSINNNITNSDLSKLRISYDLAQNSVISIIKQIKSRWHSRLGLFKQIYALENKNIDFIPNNVIKNCNNENNKATNGIGNGDDDDNDDDYDENICNMPIRISGCLVQWKSITWDEYSNLSITQRFVDENLFNCNDMFYQAIITRGSAKLECFINISANFPINTPIWALNLSWNGKHDALNDTAIREMEHWINSIDVTTMKLKRNLIRLSSSILSIQLKRCMSCLDIFLETEGQLYSPAEFTQDKTYLKAFRGRTRSRPYKIVQNGGSVYYKQL